MMTDTATRKGSGVFLYSFQRSIASPVQGEVAFAEQMTEGLYSYRIPSVG